MQQEIKSSEGPVDERRLATFLAAQPLFRERLPIRNIERIGMGQSNMTYRVTLRDLTVVLRRPPVGPLPPSAHDVLREYRVLCALTGGPVPVPRPLLACADSEIIGAPFYLMEALPGDAIREELPPALAREPLSLRRNIGMQAIETLVKLHALAPETVGLGNLGRPTGYIARQLRRWRGQLDYARTRPVPDLDWTSRWLEEHQPPDVARPTLVHGDYKLDNLIFSTEPPLRLLGVVDWEMATLGDPLADLGWLLAFWYEAGDPVPTVKLLPRGTALPGFSTRAELAQYYAKLTRRELPELTFYIVLARWKMAISLENHWARHIRGTDQGFDFAYLETGNPAFAARIRRFATTASER